MIPITKSFLPPQEEYQKRIREIWQSGWLTNRGSQVLELEDRLKQYLKVKHLLLMTNGTLPIQITIKSLNKKGEIITTPFSYVATTSSIVWEGCQPIYVDIEPDYFTIDPQKIEEKITEKTIAILATHVYGNPCDIEAIQSIASKHNLPVFYDAAHCFGVDYKGRSILNYGDVSTLSFHATKVFHTGEGGAAIVNNTSMIDQIFYGHNFGHNGTIDFSGLGINAKMSEFQAAMGLSILPYMDIITRGRRFAVKTYDNLLKNAPVRRINIRPNTVWNYSYYPVLFEIEKHLLIVEEQMKKINIFPRRYFYPSLNRLPYLKNETMPISEDISSRVLCLPLYHDIKETEIQKVCQVIRAYFG